MTGVCRCFLNYAAPYCATKITPAPTFAPSESSSEEKDHEKKGLIIGGIVVVCVVIIVIAGVVFYRFRKNKSEQGNLHFASINDFDD